MSRIFLVLILVTAWLDGHADVRHDSRMIPCNDVTHFCGNPIMVGREWFKRPFSTDRDLVDIFCVKPRSPSLKPVLVFIAQREVSRTQVIDGREVSRPVDVSETVLINKSQLRSNGIDPQPFEQACALRIFDERLRQKEHSAHLEQDNRNRTDAALPQDSGTSNFEKHAAEISQINRTILDKISGFERLLLILFGVWLVSAIWKWFRRSNR